MMRLAFEALSSGEAQNQPRRRLVLKTNSVLHSLAGSWQNYFGTKFYSTNPRYGAHFLFALYDAETAKPLALMEANHLGQIRTGAASGYATDLMAAPGRQCPGSDRQRIPGAHTGGSHPSRTAHSPSASLEPQSRSCSCLCRGTGCAPRGDRRGGGSRRSNRRHRNERKGPGPFSRVDRTWNPHQRHGVEHRQPP